MASAPLDIRKTYLGAGSSFLSRYDNTVEELTVEILNKEIGSYIYEPGVSPPVGLFNQLWQSRKDYLVELLNYVCQGSLRHLTIRITQVNSREVEMPFALQWWLADTTTSVAMKLGHGGKYEYEGVMAQFMTQADQLLASLGLSRSQCLALWGVRLQSSLTGCFVEPELLAQIVAGR